MDIRNKNEQDCGCSDPGCCEPKHRPQWKKIISVLLLLAALAIVVVKIAGNHQNAVVPASGNTAGCDTTGKSCCDTVKNPSCCPEPGK